MHTPSREGLSFSRSFVYEAVIDNPYNSSYFVWNGGAWGMAKIVVEGFPDDLYRDPKVYAARNRLTTKAAVIQAIDEFLDRLQAREDVRKAGRA